MCGHRFDEHDERGCKLVTVGGDEHGARCQCVAFEAPPYRARQKRTTSQMHAVASDAIEGDGKHERSDRPPEAARGPEGVSVGNDGSPPAPSGSTSHAPALAEAPPAVRSACAEGEAAHDRALAASACGHSRGCLSLGTDGAAYCTACESVGRALGHGVTDGRVGRTEQLAELRAGPAAEGYARAVEESTTAFGVTDAEREEGQADPASPLISLLTPDDWRRVLTNSRKKTFRACQRKHYFQYELGYKPVRDTEAIFFGNVVHTALEAWFLATDNRLEAAFAALDAMPPADEGGPDDFVRASVRAILAGYHVRWIDEPYEVLAVERQFVAPLVNPDTGKASKTWLRGGKIDVILRDLRDGRILVMDHKATSADFGPGSDYWKRMRLDSQVTEYFAGVQALDFGTPAAWVHDVIARPGLRPLKATPTESRKYTKTGALYANQRDRDETSHEYECRVMGAIVEAPEDFFARAEIVRLEDDIATYERENWQVAGLMRDAKRTGINPKNVDACVMYGSTCPYFSVCCGEASLEDQTSFLRVDMVHPELAPVAPKPAKEER